MTPPSFNVKKLLTLAFVIISLAVFSTAFMSPAVHAEGGSGGTNPPPSYVDTTTISSTGDDSGTVEDSSTDSVSYSLWDTIVAAVDALI
ncbi:MAG: hypothetical protein ACOYVF_14475 [Candidatus Zixiibacteriota bacterium]